MRPLLVIASAIVLVVLGWTANAVLDKPEPQPAPLDRFGPVAWNVEYWAGVENGQLCQSGIFIDMRSTETKQSTYRVENPVREIQGNGAFVQHIPHRGEGNVRFQCKLVLAP